MGNQKKHVVGVIGENDEILMVRKTHPTEKYMPANNDEPQLAYTVQERNAHFEICAASGRIILVCDDDQVGCIPCTANNIGKIKNMLLV